MNNIQTVAFTGHRPKDLFGQNAHDRYNELVGVIEGVVTDLVQQGAIEFRTGGAQGVDQLAFWAVERVKKNAPDIRQVVYQPFPGQSSRWPFGGDFGRKNYDKMLRRATEVCMCFPDVGGSDYAEVRHALLERNRMMLDGIDLLIAVSRDPHKQSGGTAHAIRTAQAQGTPVLWIEPMRGTVRQL